MGDEHTWRKVIEIIKKYDQPVVVVSATARTTRRLVKAAVLAPKDITQSLEIAEEISNRHKALIENLLSHSKQNETRQARKQCIQWIDQETQKLKDYLTSASENGHLSESLKDAVASVGERLSSYLFATCAPLFDLATTWIDASNIITTDSQFGSANPLSEKILNNVHQLSQAATDGKIPVIGGYYGQDTIGNITTLGFEGSDFTASVIGSALDASAIEIWTDVSGIFTCDPRIVKDAKPIKELSFTEATELAYFGAKVLHPSTMKPASKKQIPVKVKNIFEPDHPGTVIHSEAKEDGRAKALTFIDKATIITVQASDSTKGYQFLADIFEVLNAFHLPVDVVTTTEASVSLALETGRFENEFIQKLEKLGDVQQTSGQAIISLIGCNFSTVAHLTEEVLNAVPALECSMISFSKSKKNLNLVVSEKDVLETVKKLHEKVFR